jgi:hypothetical protein
MARVFQDRVLHSPGCGACSSVKEGLDGRGTLGSWVVWPSLGRLHVA